MVDAPRFDGSTGAAEVKSLADKASGVVERVKSIAASPETVKVLRQFSPAEVSELTGIPLARIKRRIQSGDYPDGTINPKNGYRSFSMSELLTIMELEDLRGPFDRAMVVAFANFKGGVAKSTSSVHYAQYEAMRGKRLLFVDLDPQGSGTSSFGLTPDRDVDPSQTARDYLQGDASELKVLKTYWPNIDLIPAALSLYSAEFELPRRAELAGAGNSGVTVLAEGLEALRSSYDIIVIDTPPALSYLTTNAIYAADGVIVPVQANMLDFSSASQFLRLLSETIADFGEMSGPKVWRFLRFLVTRFGGTDSEQTIMDWMHAIFGERTIRMPFANTGAIQAAGPEMVSIYEADPRHPDVERRIDRRTYRRALGILNPVMEEISTTVRLAAKEMDREMGDQGGK